MLSLNKIFEAFYSRSQSADNLGLGFQPGDNHYRAYVGPPQDYDLISAMVFNLLTSIGLRQSDRVLDIGCGSLRIGRLLIPYLNKKNYFGVEPNKWLVEEGIKKEVGRSLVKIKSPNFIFGDTLNGAKESLNIDFAVAQSIFSHCGLDLLHGWLDQVSFHLQDTGALVATFLVSDQDYGGSGWIYPGCVSYRTETISRVAEEYDLSFRMLDWAHPRQNWAIFSKKRFDLSVVEDGQVSWNRFCRTRLNNNSEVGQRDQASG